MIMWPLLDTHWEQFQLMEAQNIVTEYISTKHIPTQIISTLQYVNQRKLIIIIFDKPISTSCIYTEDISTTKYVGRNMLIQNIPTKHMSTK